MPNKYQTRYSKLYAPIIWAIIIKEYADTFFSIANITIQGNGWECRKNAQDLSVYGTLKYITIIIDMNILVQQWETLQLR